MSTPTWPTIARPRSSRWLVGGALGLVVLVAAACSSGSATSTTTTSAQVTGSSPGVTVSIATLGSLGPVLVDASGLTLYRYSLDTAGRSACTGGCASIWTPLTVPAGTEHVAGGAGVSRADLGIITRSDGSHQVTYKGMPLYTYTGDTKAGEATGQGSGGTWFVVSTSSTSSGSGTAAPSTTTTTTKPSGGYGY